MTEIQAPEIKNFSYEIFSVFLAGTIDMGNSINWQKATVEAFNKMPIVIFNPRRDDYEPSWEQKISNLNFSTQVNWELDHLNRASAVVFHFEPNSDSIITMAELGKMSHFAKQKPIIVHCPDGFKRKGNVDIMCLRDGMYPTESLDEAISIIKYLAFKHDQSQADL